METALAAAITLFPTSDHQEFSAGVYGFEAQATAALEDGMGVPAPQGLDLVYRRVFDTERALAGEVSTGTGETTRLRFYRGPDGEVMLDELSFDSLLLSVRSRPVLGDRLDIGLLAGRWDEVWWFGDTGRAQWRVFSPMQVTLLGFANNDMDDDERLKYYLAGGFGLGGEGVVRVAGPVGLQARVDAGGTATNRHRRDAPNTTRQELEVNAELSLGWLQERRSWSVGAWATRNVQWDPRDAEGRDGVDRDYFAGGMRLSARVYKEKEVEATDADFDALLEAIRRAEAERGDPDRPRLFERPQPDAPDEDDAEPPPPSYDLLEVHWSELVRVSGDDPVLPEGLAADAICTVRIFIAPTGEAFKVEPVSCPEEMQAAVLSAAASWRFEPVVEGGDTVSVQAVYPFTVTAERPLPEPE